MIRWRRGLKVLAVRGCPLVVFWIGNAASLSSAVLPLGGFDSAPPKMASLLAVRRTEPHFDFVVSCNASARGNGVAGRAN